MANILSQIKSVRNLQKNIPLSQKMDSNLTGTPYFRNTNGHLVMEPKKTLM